MSERFVRQVLLPEIGIEGQARIGQATAAVGGDSPAHQIATLYAEGAGFGALAAGPIDLDALAPRAIVSSPAAQGAMYSWAPTPPIMPTSLSTRYQRRPVRSKIRS